LLRQVGLEILRTPALVHHFNIKNKHQSLREQTQVHLYLKYHYHGVDKQSDVYVDFWNKNVKLMLVTTMIL
jgi:5,10-methylene-tetrahydrofolate dehydrogenase/methenyl tetrahydrofolate cyclohydrolase